MDWRYWALPFTKIWYPVENRLKTEGGRMSEVFWLGMSCYILGAVIGIAIAFFAFRNSSIKLLYRLRGDTIV